MGKGNKKGKYLQPLHGQSYPDYTRAGSPPEQKFAVPESAVPNALRCSSDQSGFFSDWKQVSQQRDIWA